MVNEYINKIHFASCLNVSEKKISLAIEKFNEEQKDQFIDKNKILLCEDSLNIFSKIFAVDTVINGSSNWFFLDPII